MKKKLFVLCLSGVLAVTAALSGLAYASNIAIKNYSYKDGVVVHNEHGNHIEKSWNVESLNEIQNDYNLEMKNINAKASVAKKKVALKNAEALLDSMTEELHNQTATSEKEKSQKINKEQYIKSEYVRLGKIHNELYPLNEQDEILKKATALKEQLNWEKTIYADNEDMQAVLNELLIDVDLIINDIESDKIKTLDEFEAERNALFEKRTELEKSSGIIHLSENDI